MTFHLGCSYHIERIQTGIGNFQLIDNNLAV